MISAQNLQRPLSGSKKIFIRFFILLMAWGVMHTSSHAGKPLPDSTFKIAMILPLHLYQYNGNNVNRANIMLDYYQGFYLALKEGEKKGLKIKVFVYDNEHDTNVTKEILLKPELKKMNLIVSPIMDEHLHILNHFSCRYQVPVFSPFTAIDSLFPNNPLFFNAAPAKKTKAEFFYDYYRKTSPQKTLVIVKNEHDWSKSFGPELVKLLETKQNIDYRIISNDELLKADSNFLSKWKDYIVFHSADDPKDLKIFISFLDKQRCDFELLADYKPQTLQLIPAGKLKKFKIKIVSSDFTNPMDSAEILQDFKINYKLISNLNPSRYSVIGHDQANFIADIFLKYGKFKANDFVGETHQYFSTKIIFKKDPHCNQNKGLFILKISDLEYLEEVKY